MTGINGIIDQLRRSVEGDAWKGASIREILDGMTARHAAAHPVPGGHSIWELVHHVTAWVRAVDLRVQGKVSEREGETDWPPVRETSERAWTAAFEDLRRAQAALSATLDTLSDVDLNAPVPNRTYDRAHLLNGVIQHHAYHAGQMALLKRAMQHQAQAATPRLL